MRVNFLGARARSGGGRGGGRKGGQGENVYNMCTEKLDNTGFCIID